MLKYTPCRAAKDLKQLLTGKFTLDIVLKYTPCCAAKDLKQLLTGKFALDIVLIYGY